MRVLRYEPFVDMTASPSKGSVADLASLVVVSETHDKEIASFKEAAKKVLLMQQTSDDGDPDASSQLAQALLQEQTEASDLWDWLQ